MQVLFKPTLAVVEQFRPTFESALSYFVASNNACTEDEGFAIKGWTKVRFENDKVTTDGNRAFAMGNYFFPIQKELRSRWSIPLATSRMRIRTSESSFITLLCPPLQIEPRGSNPTDLVVA